MVALIQFYTGKTLKDLRVLDAGCGTGNYSKAITDFGIGHVTLLDASSGMLEKAKSKMTEVESGSINDVVEALIPFFPFPDASFDAVMMTSVFHHLDKEDDDDFPVGVQTLNEVRRVLRPHGVVVISGVLKSTAAQSMWFTKLESPVSERFIKSLLSIEQYEKIFQLAGFHCLQKVKLLGTDMYKHYYDLESKENVLYHFLNFVNATDVERVAVEQIIKEMGKKGVTETWVRDNDDVDTSGLLTIFVCKPN